MERSTLELEAARFKAAETVQTGLRTLEFYAAAFSKTPDLNGDIIDPHAFDAWLPAFYAAGKPLPLSFSHAAMLDGLDPTNVIGYAPADPEHVRVDDYGLRITGFIDTSSEKGKAVEWQIDNHLIGGASIAYLVPPGGRVKEGKAFRIKTIEAVKEAGPTPNPANQEAVLLWLKSQGLTEHPTELPYMTVEEFRATFELKAVDTSAWDGNKAMGMCSTAADYAAICAAEHTVGQPGERQHYALPHHFPGQGPNADGVRAAATRVSATENITDAERASAQTHIDNHMSEISPASSKSENDEEAVETKHSAAPAALQSAHDALVKAGAKCASGEAEVKGGDDDPVRAALRRLRLMKAGITR